MKGFLNTPIVILDHAIKIGEKMLPKNTFPVLMHIVENYAKPLLENNFIEPIALEEMQKPA